MSEQEKIDSPTESEPASYTPPTGAAPCDDADPPPRHPAHWDVCVRDAFNQPTFYRIDWLILVSFIVTFIAARIMVLLIMAHWAPGFLFFHVSGTHVHHLNYGIIVLSIVGAYLLLGRPQGSRLALTALVYGVGLALTFDEFGMWLHLGGGYWQRTSFDAVVVIAAFLGMIAAAPAAKSHRPHHVVTWVAVTLVVLAFGVMLYFFYTYAGGKLGPSLRALEEQGPP